MSQDFDALVIRKDESGQHVGLERRSAETLADGDVLVRVTHSAINYKDALAVTGRTPIARRFPMIAGIDLAGTVEQSENADWKPGDIVLLNGWGLSETHDGGYAGYARVHGEWLVPCPAELTTAQAMAIGTAGYSAMLSVLTLEDHGVTPEAGPVLVTGAAGGVGSVAVAILAKLGFSVTASTGRPEEAKYLTEVGATAVIDRAELTGPIKPLAKERWAGAVDVVGSTTLANVLSATCARGTVAAVGLAGGMVLPTNVAPFILRGVTLTGIDSVYEPRPRRLKAWTRLTQDLDRTKLAAMTRHIPLTAVPAIAAELLAGKVRGRIVVDIAG